MKRTFFTLSILFATLVCSNTGLTQNCSGVSYSPLNITQAMDLAVRSNSMNYLYATSSSHVDSNSKANTRPDTLKLKNPNTALLIAVIPGFAFHGSGHFYARKSLTGLALFATEAGGIMLWRQGGNFLGSSRGGTDGELAQFLIGMTLFFGSWAWDLIGAPLAVNKENEKLLGISY